MKDSWRQILQRIKDPLGYADMEFTMPEPLDSLVLALTQCKHLVILTGAGVSAESNIPTFRDAMEGLWAKFDPEELATPQAFRRDPELVSRWYDERRMKVLERDPNPGHYAIAGIERFLKSRGAQVTLITQNVDGLHQRAGSSDVVEIHGSITTWRCTETGEEVADLPLPLPSYPMASAAGGLLRPGVVWFGEALPVEALERSQRALYDCDLYLAIGTSGLVYPVAGFIMDAKAGGARTFEMNLNPTPVSDHFDHFIEGKSGEVMPKILERLTA